MNPRCERAVTAMTTGGPLRRWWASRHADRCPHCALVRDELERIADTLTDVPPLTAAERRLWAAAARGESRTLSFGPSWLRPALAGTLAAALLAAAFAWWALPRDDRPHVLPPVVDVRPQPWSPMPLAVESLRGSVVALASELDDLGRRADLLDARKDVDALMDRLPPRGPARGL